MYNVNAKGKDMEHSEFIEIMNLINELRKDVIEGQKEMTKEFKAQVEIVNANHNTCKAECKKEIDEIKKKVDSYEYRINPIENKLQRVELRKKGFLSNIKAVAIPIIIAVILYKMKYFGEKISEFFTFITTR